MVYTPTTWVDYVTEANSMTMNNIENGIAANDAAIANKAALVHSHTSAQISDFTEAAQDAVAALMAEGTGVTLAYNDAAGTLTVTAAGGTGTTDPEAVRDTIGAALIGLSPVSVVLNDAADTITISTTATVNSTDAQLRARSSHTGTQESSTILITGTTVTLDATLRNTDAIIRYTTTAPLRASVTSDTARRAVWVGQVEPPKTTGYALTNDIFESTV